MALTELQRNWIAEVLGVDVRKYLDGAGPGAGGASPAPAGKAKEPPKAPAATRMTLAIANQSDRALRLIKSENDGGRFDPPPPEQIAPKAKASFAAVDTGAKGGTLIYQLEPKEGSSEAPEQLTWWNMSWKPAQAGQPPEVDSTLDPGAKGYSPSAAAGKGSVAFMLTGASTAAQPVSQPGAAPGQRRIDVTFVNQSDQWLKYWGADRMTATFERKPPDELKPGASATFAIFAQGAADEIHFGLMYSIVPSAGAQADANAPKWTPHFSIPANTTVMVPGSDIVPGIDGLTSRENPSPTAVSFVLSGKAAASVGQPQAPVQPQGAQVRIPITFVNDSDRMLRYWGADKMDVTFDQKPPDLIKPGQSLGFAIRGKRGSALHFGLMYSVVASETEKPENGTPKWTPHFNIAAGETMYADCDVVPAVAGLQAGGRPEKDGALFVLSGKAAASAKAPLPPKPVRPQDPEEAFRVTFSNDSNMVLRYWGADKMAVTFDQKPPDLIKPGQSLGFVIRGKRSGGIHFGLMYSILADETEKAVNETPKWTPYFNIAPGQEMIARCGIVPGVGGLKAGGWPEKGGALFALSGHWAKDQELRTPVSIKNETPYKLRLVASSAAPGRFDPAPPSEVAPGATATLASWAKVKSEQKLVYDLEPAGGAAVTAKNGPKRWTMTWRTNPGDSPGADKQLDNIERYVSGASGDGGDGLQFFLEIKDEDAK